MKKLAALLIGILAFVLSSCYAQTGHVEYVSYDTYCAYEANNPFWVDINYSFNCTSCYYDMYYCYNCGTYHIRMDHFCGVHYHWYYDWYRVNYVVYAPNYYHQNYARHYEVYRDYNRTYNRTYIRNNNGGRNSGTRDKNYIMKDTPKIKNNIKKEYNSRYNKQNEGTRQNQYSSPPQRQKTNQAPKQSMGSSKQNTRKK